MITDYVKKSSRGKATALLAMGFIIGDVITFGVLFNLTKHMSPILGFGIVSSLMLLLGIMFLTIVKEPDMKKL